MFQITALRSRYSSRLAVSPSRLISRLALATALLALAAPGAFAQADLGSPAPDFTLTGNDGVPYTMSDVIGDQVQILHMIGYA